MKIQYIKIYGMQLRDLQGKFIMLHAYIKQISNQQSVFTSHKKKNRINPKQANKKKY